jgi:hypothetical protein
MNRTAKILALCLCLAICAGGAFFSPKPQVEEAEPKTHTSPVINRLPERIIWVWA